MSITPLRREEREVRDAKVLSDERLLELAQQFIPTSVELGPIDRDDIRSAMLELYSRRRGVTP